MNESFANLIIHPVAEITRSCSELNTSTGVVSEERIAVVHRRFIHVKR